jgi:hypothetical protein
MSFPMSFPLRFWIFRLNRVRLLRNAVPAVPGGGVVFFVDPQGELELVLHF